MAQQAVFAALQRTVDEDTYLCISDKLESVKKQLMRMQPFLMDLDDRMSTGGAMVRNLVSDVREVAYEVEDIIDTANILRRQSDPKTSIRGAISKYACFPVYLNHLQKLGSWIDSANERMKTIFENFEKLNVAATAVAETWGYTIEDDTIQHWQSVHRNSDEQVNVIGFDEQIEQIKDDLLDRGSKDLTVVSITGPVGAGKSTMAKKVYGLDAIKTHFKVHAWITVSQRFVPRDLLKEMVKKLIPRDIFKEMVSPNIGFQQAEYLDKRNKDELKKLLLDFLQRYKRYLIVLDDVWSTVAWDTIRDAFPDTGNWSRIILTTQNEAVAQYPNSRKKIYKPKPLNREESIQLLLSTALPNYNSVGSSNSHDMRQNLDELKELGEDLAVKCCGLPLAIIILGGYLSRNIDIAEWKRLTSSMAWHDLITADRITGVILDLIYMYMPGHLRSCFMYIAAFPEDSHIDVQVLASLWVAEGFIPLVRGHTREEVAVKYVAELVHRCMIQVEKRASSARIKVIKVHDMLRHWGIERAQRVGLMEHCHNVEDIEAAHSEEMMKAYPVVLPGSLARKDAASTRKPRTLLDFSLYFRDPRKVAESFQGLRMLYLHCSVEASLPREIGQMRYLRYLGLGGNCLYHLPSTIGDLLSLETLYSTAPASIDHIPCSLWEIRTLRQVHVPYVLSLTVPHISSQSKVNASVFSMSDRWNQPDNGFITHIADGKRIMEAIKRQVSKNKNPNLSCCFGMWYGMNGMDIIGRCKRGFQFPDNVPDFEEMHKITLMKICCDNLLSNDKNILEIGRMRLLKVLEIGECSYTGSVMTCPSGSFPHLRRLVLHDLAVEEWKMERGSMTCLRKLTLCKCPNLSYLPEELSGLLLKLDLIAMPPGCQQGTVAQDLKKRRCEVFVSSDEKDFHHLDISSLCS